MDFVPYHLPRLADHEMRARALEFLERMDGRRSVRDFAPEPVPRELIELAIQTASTAPSGAHRQPWTFVAIDEPSIKKRIRHAAEREEYEFYEGGRAPEEWLEALQPLGTDWRKPYLELAPWIVVVFEQVYGIGNDGRRIKHYYTKESVGIACGLFITALHNMGLVTLTHTPSPMGFLREILGRPSNERPYILFPIGYPTSGCRVPALERKGLDQVTVWNPPGGGDETA
jgi:nitroreductase